MLEGIGEPPGFLMRTKSEHTISCRDDIWATFEQMASELSCTVDYLVGDAMKQYARQRGYPHATGTSLPPGRHAESSRSPRPAGMAGAAAAGPAKQEPTKQESAQFDAAKQEVERKRPAAPAPPPGAPSPLPPDDKPARVMAGPAPRPKQVISGKVPLPAPHAAPALPLPSGGGTRPGLPPPAPAPGGIGATRAVLPPPLPPPVGPQLSRPSGPPPAPGPSAPLELPSGEPGHPQLTIHYSGATFAVRKNQFVIGRGKNSSDLTIKDPNVSRQHAMIEFVNGRYFIVDLGSTNGIQHRGSKVQRKVIDDGDVFAVCDHEFRCTLS